MAFDDQLLRQQREIETIKEGLDETRAGLDKMGLKLLELSAGQDALELQTALLSSEAENEFPRAATSPAIVIDEATTIKALTQLQSQLVQLSHAFQTSVAEAETRSDMLEGQVREIQHANQSLESEVSDLRTHLSASIQVEVAGSKPEALNQGDWAKSTLRTLGDEVGALKIASSIAEGRMVQLEKRREALSAKLKVLCLQQVRNDQDFQRLRKQLKQLVAPTAIGGLLAAGLLMWFVSQA